ncbi:predicted protein [Fibroporia radiculosa]|uniref:Uncharacterized protein n=1 Tax=Fibroporia radiculosa TaxID=599839 RepID=J7SD22_9APHY|nr:predicted protein [Fibroporia radiculosa]
MKCMQCYLNSAT